METISAGTQGVLEDAYRAHYDRIRRWMRARINDKERAEDLAVETFLTLARKLEEGVEPRNMEAYLVKLASGHARNEIQRLAESREVLYESSEWVEEHRGAEPRRGEEVPKLSAKTRAKDMEPPEWLWMSPETPEDVEFRADFDRAVRALPADERDAFILGELRGLTAEEAGGVLGISNAAVSRRQKSARARVARHMGQEEGRSV